MASFSLLGHQTNNLALGSLFRLLQSSSRCIAVAVSLSLVLQDASLENSAANKQPAKSSSVAISTSDFDIAALGQIIPS
jgi:hypothetical protein